MLGPGLGRAWAGAGRLPLGILYFILYILDASWIDLGTFFAWIGLFLLDVWYTCSIFVVILP